MDEMTGDSRTALTDEHRMKWRRIHNAVKQKAADDGGL